MTGGNGVVAPGRVRRLALVSGMAGVLVASAHLAPLDGASQAQDAEARPATVAHGPALPPLNAVPRPTAGAGAATGEPAPRAVLQRYCFACHNQRARVGGLALDTLDLSRVGEHADVWEAVIRKLRTGAMPPAGRPRPDQAAVRAMATWLETELDRAALANPDPGRPTLHRLNRTEYRNAVRDLLAVDVEPSLLPADNAAFGFDNNADALTLSSALTERYLAAAAKIAEMALGRPRGTPAPETFFVPTDRDQGVRVSDDLPFGSRGGAAFRHYFPAAGEYLFEMRPKESGVAGGFEGVTSEPHRLDVGLDGVRVWSGIVQRPAGASGDEQNRLILERMRFRAPVSAGSHLVQVYFAARTSAYVEDLFDPRPAPRSVSRAGRRAGRLQRDHHRAAARNRDGRRLAQPAQAVRLPAGGCGRRVVLRAHDHLDPGPARLPAPGDRRGSGDPARVVRRRRRPGRLRGGHRAGLARHPRQPELPLPVRGPAGVDHAGTPYRISDIELASRLSFFLWSSIPDDELVDLATMEKLHDPDVLQQQVQRMLADPRSQALVDNFAGQWLHIRNVAGLQPSPELLFHFDDNLRQAFERETALFFESIIRENRSVLDLLEADYTFLNERLARHYGIPGVYGERFRRVPLPADSVRRGLLGQGSILTGTSRANRTSPVIRGKWILENVLGAPPPPPPPNVPDLVEERDPRKVLPMREQLAAHRANPVCASCHAQMDQLGFAPSRTSTRSASGATCTRRACRLTRRGKCPTARRSTARPSSARCCSAARTIS